MSVDVGAADELLARLCEDLRQMRAEAGGPSLRALAAKVGLGKSQLGDILNGRVGRLPDWRIIRDIIGSCYQYAQHQGRSAGLSRRFGIEEYWRPRYCAVEHLLSEPVMRVDKPAPVTPPRNLPPKVRHFVGRHAELAALSEAAGPVVVTGPAGVGKTALTVSWAHEAADRFPDGQLYVNLRGFDPSGAVVGPAEAVRGLIEALGVPSDQVPANHEAQVGLYRSRLAQRRMLVVLDNARDADQVRPLLPSSPGCLALVTSRSQLTGLVVSEGAQVLRLDLLSADEATEVLARRIGAQRLRAEPAAAAEIVAACARLPLALSVVASRAALQPALSLSALALELREEPENGSLEAFRTGDRATDLRTVFSCSYRMLSEGAARTLRLLGLTVGGDIGPHAVASLTGMPISTARRDLTDLVDAGMATEHQPGRYAMHDLLRAYAGELVHEVDPPAQRHAALHRLFDYYLAVVHRAANLMHPPFSDITPDPARPGVITQALGDRETAQAWFNTECAVLLAEVHHADRAGFGKHAWQLSWAMSGYLDRRGLWQDWHALQELALQAARREGDLLGQAQSHRNLAQIYSRLSRHDEAYGQLKHALDQFTILGDTAGLAHTHLNLGQVLERSLRHREALDHSRQALRLFTKAGNRAGEAYTLNAVGWQLALLGEYREAVALCERALDRLGLVADSQGEADTLDSLGYAHHHLGNHEDAVSCYQRAVDMFHKDGNRYGEASTLENLARSHIAMGNSADARAALHSAWTILNRLEHRDAERIRQELDFSIVD